MMNSPSIEIYRHIKRLSAENWANIRPALVQKVTNNNAVLVDIHLDEKDWDAAIKVAEQNRWSFQLLEKVANTVVPYRPDWVICVSLKQSDQLIIQTQSKLYPIAVAGWNGLKGLIIKRARMRNGRLISIICG